MNVEKKSTKPKMEKGGRKGGVRDSTQKENEWESQGGTENEMHKNLLAGVLKEETEVKKGFFPSNMCWYNDRGKTVG